MMQRIKSVLVVLALGCAALATSACCGKENAAATAKCKTGMSNANSCQACCKSVTGHDSYSYANSACKCM